jgi:hypothetical protein
VGCAYSHWLEQRWRYRWKYYNSIARWDTPRQRSCAWRVLALSFVRGKGGGKYLFVARMPPWQANRATEGPAKAKKGKPDVRLCLFPPPFCANKYFPPLPFPRPKDCLPPGLSFFWRNCCFWHRKSRNITVSVRAFCCPIVNGKVEILQYYLTPMACLLFVLKKKSRNITVPLTAWY